MSNQPSDQEFVEKLRTILGKRPLLLGENPDRYDQLLTLVITDLQPQTIREWLLIKDVVDAQWEFARIRGFKNGTLHAKLPSLIASRMMEVAGKDLKPKDAKLLGEQIQLMRHYLLGALRDEPDAHEQLTALLARFQLNLDDIAAIAFQVHMTKQIEIEDVAGAARERRDSAYAELEKLHERRRQQRQIISSVGSTAELPSIKAESSLVPAQSIEAAEASSAGPRTAEEP